MCGCPARTGVNTLLRLASTTPKQSLGSLSIATPFVCFFACPFSFRRPECLCTGALEFVPRPGLASGSGLGYGNHDGVSRGKCLTLRFLESLLREARRVQTG